jgi:hypothetical protein
VIARTAGRAAAAYRSTMGRVLVALALLAVLERAAHP